MKACSGFGRSLLDAYCYLQMEALYKDRFNHFDWTDNCFDHYISIFVLDNNDFSDYISIFALINRYCQSSSERNSSPEL